MTKKERQIIRQAIKDIIGDGSCFARGVSQLCGLISAPLPGFCRIDQDIKEVSLAALNKQGNTAFCISTKGNKEAGE